MTWYEMLIAAGGVVGAIGMIAGKVGKPLLQLLADVRKLTEHDREQYLAILRLTTMSRDMPISERIIAGQKYIELGGNGDVKKYYEQLLKEHTVQ